MNSQKERSQTKKPTSNVVAPLSLTKQELVITTVEVVYTESAVREIKATPTKPSIKPGKGGQKQ
ncbi:hypothetical protein BVRB_6g139530 [Beta vulgaris subsp. vulgaris]|nr:hypothetical protein BVRB_6g139530 [Beta vulgaris subsp. vulgaris]